MGGINCEKTKYTGICYMFWNFPYLVQSESGMERESVMKHVGIKRKDLKKKHTMWVCLNVFYVDTSNFIMTLTNINLKIKFRGDNNEKK